MTIETLKYTQPLPKTKWMNESWKMYTKKQEQCFWYTVQKYDTDLKSSIYELEQFVSNIMCLELMDYP